jgi:hypothetical protein
MGDFVRFGMDIVVEYKCGRKTVLPWLPVLIKLHDKTPERLEAEGQ